MTEEDLVGIAMRRSGVAAGDVVGDAELRRLLTAVIGPHDSMDYLVFSDALAALASDAETDVGFDYRVKGGWVVNLSTTAVRSVVSTALLVTALSTMGQSATNVAVETLVVALPLLVDVRRVRLSPSETRLHVTLRKAVREQAEGRMTAEELYAQLTPEVREQLSPLDFNEFLDFLGRLTNAGLAAEDPDGRIEILPEGKERLRITFE
jgi:hypothetical protein